MTSLGLPGKLPGGKLLSGPYTVTSSDPALKLAGIVTFGAQSAGAGAAVYNWNGNSWQQLTVKSASANTVSAEAPSLGTFVLVSSI